MKRKQREKKVLAVASGGGHWVQLLRLRPAFKECDVTYVTVRREYEVDIPGCRLRVINDATRWDKLGLLRMALKLVWIIITVRPHVIISTGAAPGYFAIRLGKLLRARTIWLDSIANVEQISMTGQLVSRHADLGLTQWEHLADENGLRFNGAVV